MWYCGWQWDILQGFNNLLLLYDSVIRDNLSFVSLIGLQVRRAINDKLEELRSSVISRMAQMQVSAPTHSSTLHHCTFIHHCTDVLPSACCPISTSLYRTPCTVIATAGIVVCLNYKKLRHEWERLKLSSSANRCPPHCEQTQRPSHTVFWNPQRSVQMAQQPFEQCFLEMLVLM